MVNSIIILNLLVFLIGDGGIPMLTIRHYKIFKAVAEYENMSEAAKKLYVSQPTISQTILEIEKHYNAKLFERFPKKLYITDAGKKLLSFVNPLLYAFDNVNNLSLQQRAYYKIRVGATYTVSTYLLNDVMTSCKQKTDMLDFFIQIDNTHKIEDQLLLNELDFALVDGVIKSSDIVSVPIAEDCLILVCGDKHPFATRKRVRLEELNNQDFILREEESGTRKLFETQMETKKINYNVKWASSSINAIKNAVIANQGLAIISARLIKDELENGTLFVVKNKECIWRRDVCLCYHKSKTLAPEFRPFIDTAIAYQKDGLLCPIVDELYN